MAVAVGMVMMTKASEKHGLTEAGTAYKIEEVCATYGLPTTDDASLEKIAEAAQTDKKTSGSSINVVLLEKIEYLIPLHHIPPFPFTIEPIR